MILYSIRRKGDGKRFVGWRWFNGEQYWNEKGTLFRTIDPVLRHLEWLCSDDKWEEKAIIRIGSHYHACSSRRCMAWSRIKPKVKFKRLKQYEVVIHDVAIMGIKRVPAKKYFEKGKKK